MRKTLVNLKLHIDEMEKKMLEALEKIYEVEDKLCDLELNESLNRIF